MLRGILSGLVTGTVVSGVMVVGVARFAPETKVALSAPDAGEVAVPAGSGFNAERSDVAPVLPSTEGAPSGTKVPSVTQPGPSEVPVLNTESASAPVTGGDDITLDAPVGIPLPEVSVDAEQAVDSAPVMTPPAQPGVDATPEPLAPLDQPAVDVGQGALDAPDAGAAPEMDVAAEAKVPEVGPTVQPVIVVEDNTPVPDAPSVVPEAADAPVVIAAPAPPVDAPVTVPDAPQGIGLTQPDIAVMSPGSDTDDLPRIGASAEIPADVVQEPALQRYAVAFEGKPEVPMVSLVLIDRPGGPEPSAFADFPVPLTAALDPTVGNVGARMKAWRDVGVEVVVLTPLPEGATPADVEVAFQSFLSAVPQSVAVMDLPEALLQESRPRAVQVAEILAETGHGMLTYQRGLNSGLQVAEGKGVAAAAVFREFDDGARNVMAIKRFLDQGAFRAGQAGDVVLVGFLRDETVTAITEWALGNRASTVSLAPLSAVLLAK